PDLHRRVAAAGVQSLTVGAERQAANKSGVAAEAVDQFPGPAVPDLYGAVLTPRGDPPALVIGAERQSVDLPAVSAEGLKFLTGVRVPDLDRVLLLSRRQPPAVRAERHVHARPGNPCLKCDAGFLLLTETRGVPEFHRSVAARRGQLPTVAAEDQPPDLPGVSTEDAAPLASLGIPDLHGPFQLPRDQVAAVGAECHGLVRPGGGVPLDCKSEVDSPGRRLPDPDGVLPTSRARRCDTP